MVAFRYAFCIALIWFGLCTQAHAEWIRAETDHFDCYSDGSEAALRADAMRLERFDAAARVVVGLPPSRPGAKLKVYFVGSVNTVQRLYPGPEKRVAGFYLTQPSGAFAVVPRNLSDERQGLSNTVAMFHEYTHHLMYQYFPAAYPAWYVEGFAEFLSNAKIAEDGSAKLGLADHARASTLLNEVGLPIDKIFSSAVGDLRSDQTNNFYGQSWALVHLLTLNAQRKGQLVDSDHPAQGFRFDPAHHSDFIAPGLGSLIGWLSGPVVGCRSSVQWHA
ncbi:MAG: hypothetical protein RL367_2585 [Pseudomonadota bacterium]